MTVGELIKALEAFDPSLPAAVPEGMGLTTPLLHVREDHLVLWGGSYHPPGAFGEDEPVARVVVLRG
jgi:hypothetical protein